MNPIAWILCGNAWKDLRKPISFLTFCGVLFGIPFGLLWGLHREMQDRRLRLIVEQHRNELETRVGKIRMVPPSVHALGPDLIELMRKVWGSPDPRAAFISLRNRLKKAFGGLIDIVLMDEKGHQVRSVSDPVLSDAFLEILVKDAVIAATRKYDYPPSHLEMFQKELGPFLGPWTGGLLNQVESLSVRGKWVTMFFSEPLSGYLALFLFRASLSWPEMARLLQMDLLREKYPEMRTCAVDLRRPLAGQGKSLGRARPWLRSLLRDPEAQTGGTVVKGRWVMIQQSVRKHFRSVYALPVTVPTTEFRLFGKTGPALPGLLLLLLFLLSSWIGWRWFFVSPTPFCSLRWKLGLLFLYLVALPLLLLGLAAWMSLGDYRSTLEQSLWMRQQRALQEIGERYAERMGRMESVIKRAVRKIERTPLNDLGRLLRTTQAIQKRFNPQLCDVVGIDGKAIAHQANAWDTRAKQLSTFLQSVAGAVCADLNLGGGRSLSPREQLMTATGEMMGMNIGLMYSAITRYLGELFTVQLEQAVNSVFLQPFYDPQGMVRGMILLGWDRGTLPADFYQKEVLRLGKNPGEIGITFAVGLQYPLLPPKTPFAASILRQIPRIQSEPLPVRWKETEGERTSFFTGAKGLEGLDYSVIAVSTDERIRQELAPFTWRFVLIGLTFLGMGLLTARLLAARFLEPIGHLTTGIRAIEDRHFSHRIPIAANDELGRLSGTFNNMMDGLKELEIARLVQERFFPHEPVVRGGWEVYGSCLSASRVGGDYVDYFPVGEDRIGLVIGDVSGHGVGAALIVAMAKALIAHPETVFEPGQLLDQMQRVFAATLQRRKMMSCCVVLFEPATGTFWYANAGHNVPFLVRGDGRVQTLKAGGKPLGTKNKPFVVNEDRLGPEDWLFLYTDGFVEATHRQSLLASREGPLSEECIGYERVTAALPALSRPDARACEKALRDWFSEQAAPVPQADDITVMVLCRRAA